MRGENLIKPHISKSEILSKPLVRAAIAEAQQAPVSPARVPGLTPGCVQVYGPLKRSHWVKKSGSLC